MKKIHLILFLIFFTKSIQAQDTIRVLHYTETTGFDHQTRQVSQQLFAKICDSLAATTQFVWILHATDSSEIFDNLALLQQFKVVVWSNTSGANGLTASQRLNYEQYVQTGGNYLGIHAASDTYRHSSANGNNTGVWDFYAETLSGCSVQENPNHTDQNHNNNLIHQLNHPILQGLPNPWNKTEEYYYWESGYIAPTFSNLLQVNSTGPNTYDAARMMAQFKEHAWGSRSFYTALGHAASNYQNDQNFEMLLKNALLWTAHHTSVSVSHLKQSNKLGVYPNPFTNSIQMKGNFNLDGSLQVFDMQGRRVFSQDQNASSTVDLSFLPSGIYVIDLQQNGNLIREIVVKQ